MFHQAASLRMGFNPTDVKCVGLLRETGPIPAGELATLTGLTTGLVTGMIDRLERGDPVRRASDPNDRRRVIIETVDNADILRKAGTYFGGLAEATAALLADYNETELATILDFVRRGADLMREQTAAVLANRHSS